MDYDDTYASTVQMSVVKWLLAHAYVNSYRLRQIDFITAFLNSLMKNKFLYVEQVEDFEQGDPNE
jgi:hypothetical protein